MTSITFGGAPSIEARRNFSNLKRGSQLPGYGGYIHQLKYSNGHTYGDQTHILANTRSYTSIDIKSNQQQQGQINSYRKFKFKTAQPLFNNELLKPNGVNKLTEKMVPGYTGIK
jgi:hypothetical protein